MGKLEIGSHKKISCNTCMVKTRHELKANHSRIDYELYNEGTAYEQPIFAETYLYSLWVCLGCDTGTLEVSYNHSEIFDEHHEPIWDDMKYPRRKVRDLPLKRFLQLNQRLATIYKEVIESYNADLKILCTVGLRALLEGICADKGITRGNLEKKIDKLVDFLPQNIVESLHSFRFMGNIAAHELQSPSRQELKLAIEVIEDLLNFLYELDYKARRLSKK